MSETYVQLPEASNDARKVILAGKMGFAHEGGFVPRKPGFT